MREIERHNPPLAGVLPKTYNLFTSTLLKELLKKVSEIPATLDYDAFGEFDFVLANPPLNVNAVDRERLADMVGAGRRFPFGLPRTDNANSLWIQLFYSALNSHGRAGFVMANSASDARSSEQELRRKLIEARAVDVMVAVGPNMFYTVTLPCTLWFLDKGKAKTARADSVLFIDARHIYRQVDRAHRDWTPAQIGFIANLVRLYRGEALDLTVGGSETATRLRETFSPSPLAGEGRGEGELRYRDVPGLCKAATLAEIEAQGWSLNPGRYVGVAPGQNVSDEDFKGQLETLNEELEVLNAQARELEPIIAANVAQIIEA
jgi:type I restriction enzyme M protein